MVMHARKPQRMSDGYFEKHQTHPYQGSKYTSKRGDYERETTGRSTSTNYSRNDRDNSPSGTITTTASASSLNNGNSSYRSNSPDLDSSPRQHDLIRDNRGGGGGGGGGVGGGERDRDSRFSYLQKMRERERDIYKKDKYSDKRDRRSDRDSEHRTNHDRIERRTTKLGGGNNSSGGIGGQGGGGGIGGGSVTTDKHSGSDDRDRDRDRERDLREKRDRNDRDRDRDRERDRDRDRDRNDRDRDRDRDRNDKNERNERITRIGDWSEHVSSSGKMYYYNCKTEVSQWEKPKEWIEKERTIIKDQHREYREKDRERERDDRFPRSSTAYNKHSSSRSSSRLRWPYEADGAPSTHRRRHEENADMDISPGDSTPTSETSYSVSSTPTTQMNDPSLQQQQISSTGTPLGGCSTSLTSSSSTATSQPILLANVLPRLASHPPISINSTQMNYSSSNINVISGVISSSVASSSTCLPSVVQQNTGNNCHRKLDAVLQTSLPASSPTQQSIPVNQSGMVVSHIHHQQSQSSVITQTGVSCLADLHLNSNTPGPPSTSSVSNYQKLLSQVSTATVATKSSDHIENNTQKAIQTLNASLMRQQMQPQAHYIGCIGGVTSLGGSGIDTASNVSSLSGHSNLDSNHSNSTMIRENPLNSPLYSLTHMHAMSPLNHSKNAVNAAVISAYTCNTPFGLKTVESGNTSSTIMSTGNSGVAGGGIVSSEGPPTPTQELDLSGSSTEQRKLEGTSASLSSLQSCVTSSQSGRSQGPDLSPKLAKYFRADLITHVTNWPADILEKQAQKCSEETHIYGDLQCTKVSADLKCARSLVRITEITATLQEQKIMYLRQQIRRLEELKSQNSFMSDDL